MCSHPNEGPSSAEPESQRFESESQADVPGSVGPPCSSPSQRSAYYTPPPSTQRPTMSATSSKTRWGLVAVGVLTAAVVAWGGRYVIHNDATPGPISESSIEKTFSLSRVDEDFQATESLKAILATGSSTIEPAATELRAANAQALKALARNSTKTADEIQSGRRSLYRVHLLDSLAQDGDEVELFVDGDSFGRIPLSNAGTEILLPLERGAKSQMKVVAMRDGEGGVTFGMISSQGEARTGIMQIGEFDQWQITIR